LLKMAFSALLGDVLIGKGGEEFPTSSLDGKYVALYFSAHWCPPCRGFTPALAKAYTSHLHGKGLEIVFVSSDKGQQEFNEYFGEMPWKALPFSDRDRKASLSKKFKVNGIPTLVILDTDGSTITTDGRSNVDADPEGTEFPWKPQPVHTVLGSTFVNAEGQTLDASAISGKVLGLYFSAHWCPPCRGFTPQLAGWYKHLREVKKDLPFEIVFVSSDRDEKSFGEYLKEMPWIALPYSDRKAASKLDALFGIEGIPAFVIVDAEGRTVTKNGRVIPKSDPEGENFPWEPKAVKDLNEDASLINENTAVVVFAEGADAATLSEINSALEPLAKKFNDEAKAKGEEPAVLFYSCGKQGNAAVQIRKLCSLPPVVAPHEHPLKKVENTGGWGCDGCGTGSAEERHRCSGGCDFDLCEKCFAKADEFKPQAPVAIILDIPDNGGYYLNPSEESSISAESIGKFVDQFQSKTLTRKQLGE